MKFAAWVALAYLLYYTGLAHLFRRFALRGRVVVLMYHRVLSEAERRKSHSSDGIVVDTGTFHRQLAFLRRHFNVISPQVFVEHLRQRRPFPDASCLVTFDDGWSDNFAHALPALRKYGVPAVIFLPTDYIGTGRQLWTERTIRQLHRLYRRYRQVPEEVTAVIEQLGLRPLFENAGDGIADYIETFVHTFKNKPVAEMEAILKQLDDAVGSDTEDDDIDTFLDWQQVRSMASTGVTFGSHATSHHILTKLDRVTVMHELRNSRDVIAGETGMPVSLLAYPNGDHDEQVVACARATGFDAAFTTGYGSVAVNDDPFTLKRVNIHERTTRRLPAFYALLLGIV